MEASAATFSSEEAAFFLASVNKVLTVEASKASNGKASTVVIAMEESGKTETKPPEMKNLEEAVPSKISTTPGFNCSTIGTWLAKIPMSPETAGTLTWVTSFLLKMVWKKKRRGNMLVFLSQVLTTQKKAMQCQSLEDVLLFVQDCISDVVSISDGFTRNNGKGVPSRLVRSLSLSPNANTSLCLQNICRSGL